MASCLQVSTSEPCRNLPSLHMPATFLTLLIKKYLRVGVNVKVHYPGRLSLTLIAVLNQIDLMHSFLSYFFRAPFYLSSHVLLGFFQVFQIDFLCVLHLTRNITYQFHYILCYLSFFYGDSVFFRVPACRYRVFRCSRDFEVRLQAPSAAPNLRARVSL